MIALLVGVNYWANRPTADIRLVGPYEPALEAAPLLDDYTSQEIAPFSMSIDEVPMDDGIRWAYESSFGQLITIDYLEPEEGTIRDYRLALRSLDHNMLYTMYVSRDGSRLVERNSAEDGPISMAYEFPLAVGKQWNFVTESANGSGDASATEYTVTVEAAEELTVPNGTYACLRIRSVSTDGDSPGTVLWYAPNVGTVRLRTGDGASAELIYFGLIHSEKESDL